MAVSQSPEEAMPDFQQMNMKPFYLAVLMSQSPEGATPDFQSWRCSPLKTKGLRARFANLPF